MKTRGIAASASGENCVVSCHGLSSMSFVALLLLLLGELSLLPFALAKNDLDFEADALIALDVWHADAGYCGAGLDVLYFCKLVANVVVATENLIVLLVGWLLETEGVGNELTAIVVVDDCWSAEGDELDDDFVETVDGNDVTC